MDDSEVGHLMRRWRKAAGWSQEQCGGATGMPQSSWSRVEAGKRPLKFTEALDLASELGIDPACLLEDPLQILRRTAAPF